MIARWRTALIACVACFGLGLAAHGAQEAAEARPASTATVTNAPATTATNATPERNEPWSEHALELAGRLPLQDGGRVKPLSTYASFTLLRLSGKRSLASTSGVTLDATAWLLDVFFQPRRAEREPLFLVQDSDAIEAIGLSIEGKKKRDRWSHAELAPGVPKLIALAHQYDAIEPKLRTSLQQQVVTLAENVFAFESLRGAFDWARADLPVAGERVRAVFGGAASVSFSNALARAPELARLHTELTSSADPAAGADLEALYALERAADATARASQGLRYLPPAVAASAREEWFTPWSLLSDAFGAGAVDPRHVRALEGWERVARGGGDAEAGFVTAEAASAELAHARGEDEKLALELAYYRWSPIGWSHALFGLAFLAAALLWIRPTSSALHRAAFVLVAAATTALVAAIALRCAIRGRPPVSTLYETVLFVTATGALVALALELMNRRRIAVSAAAVLGLVGLFVATGYETLDKQDTMPSLVAVLDTNFWLATHVTAITIGYAAGMLAALLASLYLLARVLRVRRNDPVFFRELARMVYGVTCFGAIFAIVGTILGGIWANESWGRFWGWDPKENGALLIVIWQVAMLHARLAGWLREYGLCIAAAFGGTVIAFSWWGVNLLGVGLHSYGFTSGIQAALWSYYVAQWALCLAAGAVLWRARALARAAR
ncbi:MAG: cytochrome c biogenesis protein CcsA [Planctomycetes bacterium]|nr:cytochrome c biogenesis protein CcsA [Planctomycetota bacterium]